jgi:catechol 2,3-dioxygenase-like lactoylglutathione lyase family enzyme
MMFNGAHVLFFSRDADADRAFLRDTLSFPAVDAGEGWLIFKLPPAEVAVHPTSGESKHELYLMCADIEKVLGECTAKGVEIVEPVSDQGWGLLASIRLPSGTPLPLYEPRHPVAYDLQDR